MPAIHDGRAAISPDLAVRVEMAGVSTARAWLSMQTNFDLARAMKHEEPLIRAVQKAAA